MTFFAGYADREPLRGRTPTDTYGGICGGTGVRMGAGHDAARDGVCTRGCSRMAGILGDRSATRDHTGQSPDGTR